MRLLAILSIILAFGFGFPALSRTFDMGAMNHAEGECMDVSCGGPSVSCVTHCLTSSIEQLPWQQLFTIGSWTIVALVAAFFLPRLSFAYARPVEARTVFRDSRTILTIVKRE